VSRIVFHEVSIRATKHWREGARRRTQTRKFYQTLNPWNKNAAGQPKSREEILAELIVERDAWLAAATPRADNQTPKD
jgi:hypothetical protein